MGMSKEERDALKARFIEEHGLETIQAKIPRDPETIGVTLDGPDAEGNVLLSCNVFNRVRDKMGKPMRSKTGNSLIASFNSLLDDLPVRVMVTVIALDAPKPAEEKVAEPAKS